MANLFDDIDPPKGATSSSAPKTSASKSSNLFDDIDSTTKTETVAAQDDPNRPTTYGGITTTSTPNEPEKPVGIIQRAREGAAEPMESSPLGIKPENLEKYPWLKPAQPVARTLDVMARTPASIWGGVSGAIAGAAEPFTGRAQANRLQRDVNVLPMAVAPEVPMVAGETAGMRGPKAEARPPARPPPLPVEPPPLPPEVSAIPRQVDRPRADVGLLQPDVPHALPAEQSRSLSAAGTGGPLAQLSPDTVTYLRERLAEQGYNAHTLDDRLAEMSAHHFFGEISPSLESDMGGIAIHRGPGNQEILGSIRQRALEAPERVRHTFDRAFGPDENMAQLTRSMEADRAIASDPLYREFRNTEVSPTPAIDAIMPRLQASGALRAANEALAIEGIPSTRGFLEMRGPEVEATHVPTAAAFQYAKEAIDRRVQKALADGDGPGARRFTMLHNDLVSALDNHPLVGDTWRRARETYAQPSEIMDAANMGRRVLTGHIPANDLPFMTAAYSEPQMRAMRIGMRDYLENMLGKRDTLTAETVNTVMSPNNIQKMRWAIGDAATDAVVTAMEAERHMHGTPTRVHGNSVTASRTEAGKRWAPSPDEASGITLGDIAGAVKHPFRSGASAAAGAAERFGVNRRQAAAKEKWDRIREEASRIYTLQGPERDAVARYLIEGPPGIGDNSGIRRARGGAVNHNHNPSEAQKKAGNYAKTHKFFQGLDITIENLKGHPRSGIGKDGKKWSVRMPAHYGYLKRTEGADGDHVDVYLGPNEKSDQVFVVDQKDAETGKFDEHKVLAGFNSEAEARRTYRAGFSDGKDRIKHLRRMSMSEFRDWLEKGDTSKQIKSYSTGGAVKRALQSLKDYADGGAPEEKSPFDWSGVGEAMPEHIGRERIMDPLVTIPKRVAYDLPKELVEHSRANPLPGLRREDYTDVPADTSPDPKSALSGVGIAAPKVGWQPVDPMVGGSLEAGMNVMGGTALSAPTGAAGAGPVLRPAIRVGERIYRGPEGGTHMDALSAVPENLKQAATLDSSSRGFVNDRGRFLDREAAQHYARNTGLIDPAAPSWAHSSSELIADNLAKPKKDVTLGAGTADKRGAVAAAAPIWRSAVEDAIETLPMKSAPADQWANTLRNAKGIKPEEMDWLGLNDFLASKIRPGQNRPPVVTKQELLDHVAGNRIELKDVSKGDISDPLAKSILDIMSPKLIDEIKTPADIAQAKQFNANFRETVKGLSDDEILSAVEKAKAGKHLEPTKFSSYQLPGGENYREHLLTMPREDQAYRLIAKNNGDLTGLKTSFKNRDDAFQYYQGLTQDQKYGSEIGPVTRGPEFKSSHWDEPNVLAHVRTNDRVMESPEGPKKTLHLEEVQSDWHQSGRKRGYGTAAQDNFEKVKSELLQKHGVDSLIPLQGMADKPPELAADLRRLDEAYQAAQTEKHQGMPVPNAPFKDTDAWAGLAMKRMIREAAEKGYDRVSWTPGEAQAARYDLSKQVDSLLYQKNPDGTFKVSAQIGERGQMLGDKLTDSQLADHVGKDVAEKIVKGEGKKENLGGSSSSTPPDHWNNLSGVDLKVGGEGMREFYDKMLPKIAEKIGKAHGVKVKRDSVPTGKGWTLENQYGHTAHGGDTLEKAEASLQLKERSSGDKWHIKDESKTPVHYFDITPSLKAQALKGFSAFKKGGRVTFGKPRSRSVALRIAYQSKREHA